MDRKIKVLFVITQSEIGGAQRFFLELLPRLNPEKYEIAIAVGSDSSPSQEFTNSITKLGFKIFNLNCLQRNPGFLLFKDWRAVFELRKLIKSFRPDTLFLNSSKAGFIGSLATVFPFKLKTENCNLKTIYRIGGWTFNDPWPWWKKKFWILLEKISAHWKNLIIVNNQHDLEQARQLKIGSLEKTILIHNGLDPYRLEFLEKEEAKIKIFEKAIKTSGSIFQTKTMVGTIANLYPSKDLENLIETADLLKEKEDLIFVVIGDGPLKESLKFKVENLKLGQKVFLLGHLENASQYLPAFDIFLLPSVKEGFPWAVLEAMSAKLPVIATRVGAVPEIIEDGKNGFLVEPSHPEQIAPKIEELLKNDYLQKKMGIQGHQTVLFKFSLEKMVKEIEAVL